ncbi:hypothetical protein PV05_09574 [Exophiala xenobiotica]|uniref:Clr5 domain-containing protein n=1 Tax=Exophiala xenobiotica TaxID=348802 RepID=A0A0D2CLP2_9EURO|nr:uncharacterized protein PV05_09574 [Exophiala xenobiotica]KIW50787.1 hypothetical protein PV05_09574 [Exophiala xenobiotica]
MSNIVFIDVQDKSNQSKTRARHHAAVVVNRRKRLASIQNHQRNSAPTAQGLDAQSEDEHDPEWETIPTSDAPSLGRSRSALITQRSSERRRSNNTIPSRHRWRIGPPTTIMSTGDDLKVEFVLSQSFNWMLGQYSFPWSSLVKENPNIFDMDNKLEIFRETFYIVSTLLELKKVNAAFAVLKETLDAVPDFLRDKHPELLFSLVELAYGINMPNSSVLHAKIKPHVAEMASVILGHDHPLTVLLRSDFDRRLRTHVTEVVFSCIIDSLSKTFGESAYQTLVHQFGRSQFYARTGRSEEGQRIISKVVDNWNSLYGPDSILSRLAELQCNLMQLQRQTCHDVSLQAQINNIKWRIEAMSGVYRNKFTSKPSPALWQADRSSRKLRLARWFLQHEHYTFALHCYERSMLDAQAESLSPFSSLADSISNIVEISLQGDLLGGDHVHIIPSQAPMSESMIAMT